MDYARWKYLETNQDAELTHAEIAQGWHWCEDWDFLLIGPGMSEFEIRKGRCLACGMKVDRSRSSG